MSSTNVPLKVGFIGLSTKGWASLLLAPALTQPALRDKYSLVALATRSETSATASAKKWSEEVGHEVKAYHGGDPRNILEGSPDLDLVAVSVRVMLHRQTILPVIQARKNFFIEWPAGRTGEETREIAAEAKKYGVRSIVGFQGRNSLVINKAKELIESGKIGKVYSANIVAHFPRELGAFAPEHKRELYALDKSNGATIFTVPIGHQLDTLTYLLGNVKTISALGKTHYPTVAIFDEATGQPTGETRPYTDPDHLAINALLSSGVLLNILWRVGTKASTPGRVGFTAIIDGEDGTIKLESNDPVAGVLNASEVNLYVNGEKVEVPGSEAGILGLLTRNWEEYTKGEEEGRYATIEDAVRIKNVLDALEESIGSGRRVDVKA